MRLSPVAVVAAYEFKLSLRRLLARPVFAITFVSIVLNGLLPGLIGFNAINNLLLRNLPYLDPANLVAVGERKAGVQFAPMSAPNFLAYRAATAHLADFATTFTRQDVVVTPLGRFELLCQESTRNLFSVFGAVPVLGRTFTSHGSDLEAILTHSLWAKYFQSDPLVVTQSLIVRGRNYSIVGVMPESFPISQTDIWLTAVGDVPEFGDGAAGKRAMADNDTNYLRAVARLHPGTTTATLNDVLRTESARLRQSKPVTSSIEKVAWARRLDDWLLGDAVARIRLLALIAFGILLMCVLNVIQLVLLESVRRQHDFKIRYAIGGFGFTALFGTFLDTLIIVTISSLLATTLTLAFVKLGSSISGPIGALMHGFRTETVWFQLVLILVLSAAVSTLIYFLQGRSSPAIVPVNHVPKQFRVAIAVWLSLEIGLAFGLSAIALNLWLGVRDLTNNGIEELFGETLAINLVWPEQSRPPDVNRRILLEFFGRRATMTALAYPGPLSPILLRDSIFTLPNSTFDLMADRADLRFVSSDFFKVMKLKMLAGGTFDDDRQALVAVVDARLIRSHSVDDVIGRQMKLSGFRDRAVTIGGIVDVPLSGKSREIFVPAIYLPFNVEADFANPVVRPTVLIRSRSAADRVSLESTLRTSLNRDGLSYVVSSVSVLSDVARGRLPFRPFEIYSLVTLALMGLTSACTGAALAVTYAACLLRTRFNTMAALGANTRMLRATLLRPIAVAVVVGIVAGLWFSAIGAKITQGWILGLERINTMTLLMALLISVAPVLGSASAASWLVNAEECAKAAARR